MQRRPSQATRPPSSLTAKSSTICADSVEPIQERIIELLHVSERLRHSECGLDLSSAPKCGTKSLSRIATHPAPSDAFNATDAIARRSWSASERSYSAMTRAIRPTSAQHSIAASTIFNIVFSSECFRPARKRALRAGAPSARVKDAKAPRAAALRCAEEASTVAAKQPSLRRAGTPAQSGQPRAE
jgi:hypothetical protein